MIKTVLCLASVLFLVCYAFPDIDVWAIIAAQSVQAPVGSTLFSPAILPCDTKVTADVVTTDLEGETLEYTATTSVYGRYMMLHYDSENEEFYEIIRPDLPSPTINNSFSVYLGNAGRGEKLCFFMGYQSSFSRFTSVIGNYYNMVTMNRTYKYKLEVEYDGKSGTAYIIDDTLQTVVYADDDGHVIAIKDTEANYSFSYGTSHRRDFALSTSYDGCRGPRADIYMTPENDSYVFCVASSTKVSFAVLFVIIGSILISLF